MLMQLQPKQHWRKACMAWPQTTHDVFEYMYIAYVINLMIIIPAFIPKKGFITWYRSHVSYS